MSITLSKRVARRGSAVLAVALLATAAPLGASEIAGAAPAHHASSAARNCALTVSHSPKGTHIKSSKTVVFTWKISPSAPGAKLKATAQKKVKGGYQLLGSSTGTFNNKGKTVAGHLTGLAGNTYRVHGTILKNSVCKVETTSWQYITFTK